MARVVLDTDIGTGLDEGLHAVEVRVQRGPVQRGVARVVAVVDQRRDLVRAVGGEGLEEVGENFYAVNVSQSDVSDIMARIKKQ